PLTTTFTPPAECASRAWRISTVLGRTTPVSLSGNSTATWTRSTESVLQYVSTSVACEPAQLDFYSPGLICPEGWTAVRTGMTTYYGNSVDRQHPVTWMPCCPRYVLFSLTPVKGEL